jgi:NADPH:quinone reductase-like Zn-dependent oxidoreductase
VVSLVRSGKIAMKVDKSFPLADAAKAREYSKDGHAEGKIILVVDAGNAERK